MRFNIRDIKQTGGTINPMTGKAYRANEIVHANDANTGVSTGLSTPVDYYNTNSSLRAYQSGGYIPVARTRAELYTGLKDNSKNSMYFPNSNQMTMKGMTTPVKYYGVTDGKITDEGVAYPGQDFNVNGQDTVEFRMPYQNGGLLNQFPYATKLSRDQEMSHKYWLKSMPSNLQYDDPNYDSRAAWLGEAEPEYQMHDQSFHLNSRNPKTGELYKSQYHPTFDLQMRGELEAGYTPYSDVKTGRMYSYQDGGKLDPRTQSRARAMKEGIYSIDGEAITKWDSEKNQRVFNDSASKYGYVAGTNIDSYLRDSSDTKSEKVGDDFIYKKPTISWSEKVKQIRKVGQEKWNIPTEFMHDFEHEGGVKRQLMSPYNEDMIMLQKAKHRFNKDNPFVEASINNGLYGNDSGIEKFEPTWDRITELKSKIILGEASDKEKKEYDRLKKIKPPKGVSIMNSDVISMYFNNKISERKKFLEDKKYSDVYNSDYIINAFKKGIIDYKQANDELIEYHNRSNKHKFEQGGIYIKPSKRGTFTAAAKRHGASVQEFASRVLANKDNYSPAMVKKAVFARNSSKWNR